MFFLMGSTFIFGSWICEADGDDKLQGCLLEDSEHQDKIFLVGSTFIFESWICEMDGDGKLQGRLLKNSEHHEAHVVSALRQIDSPRGFRSSQCVIQLRFHG
jgi:hypothetical protein